MARVTAVAPSPRPFVPGTTGWTARDLDDPEIERQWFSGRFEIIDGVLTTMAPAYFTGSRPLQELVFQLKTHLKAKQLPDDFGGEVDIVIDEDRIVRADAVWLTPQDQERQRQAMLLAGKTDPKRTRVLVPPTLVIESISPGHERHDERTKRRWYAEFGTPNYWILNAFARSLKCLVRDAGEFRADAEGSGSAAVHPSLFPGLTIDLATLWLD
jgi:Uma2 family endonuclease